MSFGAEELVCINCGKAPGVLHEYIEAAADEGLTPEDYVRLNEGTYNAANGHFACSACYIAIGMPSSPGGWVAP